MRFQTSQSSDGLVKTNLYKLSANLEQITRQLLETPILVCWPWTTLVHSHIRTFLWLETRLFWWCQRFVHRDKKEGSGDYGNLSEKSDYWSWEWNLCSLPFRRIITVIFSNDLTDKLKEISLFYIGNLSVLDWFHIV